LKKIGIDAKWYFSTKNPSGRTVIQNWLFELSNINSYEFVIFLDKRYQDEIFPVMSGNFTLKYIWAKNNFISNVFIVPFYAFLLKIDLVVYQYFNSPWGAHKKIAFIHDAIFESHPEYFGIQERFYFGILKYTSKFADGLGTVSENEKRRFEKYGYKPDNGKIFVVYNGVAQPEVVNNKYNFQTLETTKQKLNLPSEFILYVGRLNIRKNILGLIKALPYVNYPDISLVIVGSENWKSENLRLEIDRLKLNNKIIFTGFLSDNELLNVIKLSKLFCFVSLEEGFGLPPLEAMTLGIPVVVSEISCLPEICGNAALYVDPFNPENIAEGITELLTSNFKRESAIEKGFLNVSKFKWEYSVLQLLSAIDGILSDS